EIAKLALAKVLSVRELGSLTRYQDLERRSARVVELRGPDRTARVRVEMDPREAENLRRQFRVEMSELATGLGLSDFDVESVVRSYLPEVEGPYELEVARDGTTTVHTDHQDPITKRFHTTSTQRALPFAGALENPDERTLAAPQRAEAL